MELLEKPNFREVSQSRRLNKFFERTHFKADFRTEFESIMAEGPKKKMRYEVKKEFFEANAENFTCSICKIVPREGSLYVSTNGDEKISCATCRTEKLPNSVRMPGTEGLLQSLPVTSCRFKKNNCPVIQDPKNIAYHEEDCQFREIECPFCFCKDSIPQSTLDEHLISHSIDFVRRLDEGGNVKCENGKAFVYQRLNPDFFLKHTVTRCLMGPINYNGKLFFVHTEKVLALQSLHCWVQMYGSKFEAKNFKYTIQLQESDEYGSPTYKGPVKSLDDSKTKVFESKIGLNVHFEVVKKYLKRHALALEVTIEDLKPKDDEDDRDSMVSNNGD